MQQATTRRRFLQTAGAATAVTVLAPSTLDSGRASARHDRPNVVVLVVDTLRADHVYGDRAKTPTMDALAREGLSFTRAFPEAMPTVPARKSILTGRRQFPFRHWHDYPGLLAMPGWTPIPDLDSTFTSVLRQAGYWTAYVRTTPSSAGPPRTTAFAGHSTDSRAGAGRSASRIPATRCRSTSCSTGSTR
jgi:arylsulfatase A-like enzyme